MDEKEKEVREMLKRLNQLIESADDELKINSEVKGIVIIRFTNKGKHLTALGECCFHCVAEIGFTELLKQKVTDLHDIFSSTKEGIAY